MRPVFAVVVSLLLVLAAKTLSEADKSVDDPRKGGNRLHTCTIVKSSEGSINRSHAGLEVG